MWHCPTSSSVNADAMRLVFTLTEDEFSTPTRCEPWDIKALVAHMWRDQLRIPTVLAATPGPPEVDVDAVGYWTSYDGRGRARDRGTRGGERSRICDQRSTHSGLG